MKTELIRIGNSRGIRIPKPFIEQCRFGDEVELEIENERLIISMGHCPRQGWESLFHAAGSSEDNEILLESAGSNEFDRKDWRW